MKISYAKLILIELYTARIWSAFRKYCYTKILNICRRKLCKLPRYLILKDGVSSRGVRRRKEGGFLISCGSYVRVCARVHKIFDHAHFIDDVRLRMSAHICRLSGTIGQRMMKCCRPGLHSIVAYVAR